MKRQKVHHVPEPEHTLTRHHQVKPNGHASTPTTSNATTKTGDRLGPSVDSPDMLALQVEELLAKVRPNYGMRMSKVEDVLRKLRQIIDGIPHREAMNTSEAERKLQKSLKIAVPFPEPRPGNDTKYTLAYTKPADISIIGSYAHKTAVQIDELLVIDIAITMPSDLFQEKDYLNHRYFHKRAFYLACIAVGIQESKESNFAILFAYQNCNPLQPILLINPAQDGGEDDFRKSKCQLRVIFAVGGEIFPIAKMMPDKNCIRIKRHDTLSLESAAASTPFYNSTLRSECSTLSYLKFIHKTAIQCEAFKDTCVLGSVWLRQRGLGTTLTDGGFGPFEWASTTAILIEGGKLKDRPTLSSGYSSYQLFQATLQFLSTRDLIQCPLFFQSKELPSLRCGTPLIYDGPRGLNILFKMTSWSYELLRLEARVSLKALNDPLSNQFDLLFITKADNRLQRFDSLLSLSFNQSWKPSPTNFHGAGRAMEFSSELYRTLSTGLGDRIALVYPKYSGINPWPMASSNPSWNGQESVLVGLVHNPEQMSRTVDHGPPAQDKIAAAAFRKFWGEKAELRRFKDGSILESIVWTNQGSENSILQQIIAYVTQRHLGQDISDGISFLGSAFDRMLPFRSSISSIALSPYQPLLSAFEILEKHIRGAEGLPLQIRQVSMSSPDLRYASVSPPNPSSFSVEVQPADIYIQFEGSTRWPDELSAVQRTKIAFLLKMGELLEESITGLEARLGLEQVRCKYHNAAFLDVVFPTRHVFRLRIHHDRELALLGRALKDKQHEARGREEIALATSAYKRHFIQGPLHTQATRTLCTRFPLLSPSMRLMKKWRDCHLLSSHISEELIELLTIRTFVHPYPWQSPGSVMTGFLRTLALIARWEWQSEPLIVDLNGDMNTSDIEMITLRFEAWRKIDPGLHRMVLFVASNLDPSGITWTERKPSKVVAARFTSLAKAACTVVKNEGLGIDPAALFASSTADYDFVIRLKPEIVGKSRHQGKNLLTFKNLQVQAIEDAALVGFDPVSLYLDELESLYGTHIIFFHDAQTESLIAGLWKPGSSRKQWKVNMSYSAIPVPQEHEADGAANVNINKAAILNDIARLGGNMVSEIKVKG